MVDTQILISDMKRYNINVSYTGAFDSEILAVIAKNVEKAFSKDPKLNKKLFKIFIEFAQNIALYSAERISEDNDGHYSGFGSIMIREFEDSYMLATGNKAGTNDLKPAVAKCEKINNLSRDELRKYKRTQRRLPPGKKGGGNIGLIQVALMAGNPIEYKTIKLDNDTWFYIQSVLINKHN